MRKRKLLPGRMLLLLLFTFLSFLASAHTIELRAKLNNDGSATFYARTYHGTYELPSGGFIVDGVTYPFQGVIGTAALPAGTVQISSCSYPFSSSDNYQYVTVPAFNSCVVHTFGCTSSAAEAPLCNLTNAMNLGGPQVTTQPAFASGSFACLNETATINVTASGSNLTYQWQINTGSGFTNVANDAVFSGAQSASLTINPVAASMNGYKFRCVLTGTDACNNTSTVTSNEVALNVGYPAAITTQPADQTICSNNNASFSVSATGSSLTYQWLVSTDGGASFSPIAGATGSTLNLGSVPASASGNQYHVQVTGYCGAPVTSRAAMLTVTELAITAQPQSISLCSGQTASFSVSARDAATYQWLVSTDGGATWSAIADATSTTYSLEAQTGDNGKLVRVVLTGTCGTELVSDAAVLTVKAQPVAGFSTANSVQCQSGNSFIFTNTSTVPTGTNSYSWDFGDGATSSEQNPAHAYSAAGSYPVTLVATSDGGCVSTVAHTVTVNPQPVLALSVETAAAQCITNNRFTYQYAVQTPGSTIRSYEVRFGDGNVFALSPGSAAQWSGVLSHTYAAAGTYSVKLVAVSAAGCSDSTEQTVSVTARPSAGFTVNTTGQCLRVNSFSFSVSEHAEGVNYQWSFGDATASSGATAAHTYTAAGTYTLKLVATSAGGCADSSTQTVSVYEQPVPGFRVNKAVQCLSGNEFIFLNNSTIGSGSVAYSWTFGDGTTSEAINPVHSYAAAGTYTVGLTVRSEHGCVETTTQTVTVSDKPQAAFAVNAEAQCFQGHEFVFTNQSTGTGLSHYWTFGDGTSGRDAQPSKSYGQPGYYPVALVVTTAAGCSDTASMVVRVVENPAGSVHRPATTMVCEGATVRLETSGGVRYQWYRNSEAVAGATAAVYEADRAGTYSVELFNAFGCSTMSDNSITLTSVSRPQAGFDWQRNCAGVPVAFTNRSSGNTALSYEWSYGDGFGSTLKEESHVYSADGTYTVQLVALPEGCPTLADTAVRQISVEAPLQGIRLAPKDVVAGRPTPLEGRPLSTSYTWAPATGLDNAHSPRPTANVSSETLYTIRMQFASGCTTIDTLQVRVFCKEDVFIPSGFTPDGDGRNDLLKVKLVEARQLVVFRVFNRWGNVVFQTNDPQVGWDGTWSGRKLSTDTFYWSCTAIGSDGKTIKKSGSVTLIR